MSHGAQSRRQAPGRLISHANEAISVQGARLSNSVFSPSTREHSTVQVFRYSAEQLRETGQTNILAAIAQLSPAVTSSPFGGIGGNGLNKTMQLRNLGADQTLMLVNGKRRHVDANFNYFQSGPNYGTDPADLSLIPISAIDHVEIITEGATALYGQDAEAGAVNIVLKRDTRGGSINLQNSGYYLGDGQAFDGNADYGMALGHDGGYFNVAAQISNQLSTNRSGNYPGNLYFPGDPRNQTASKDVQRIAGTPRTLLETLSTNTAYPVGDRFEIYNTSTFAHKDMVQAQTYRAPSNDTVVRAIYPNGMQPLALAQEYDFQVDNGIRARDFLGMQWDAYVNYGRDSMATHIANTVNPTLGTASPTTFLTSLFISTELAAGLRATKFFHPSVLPKPVSLSYGFEYRFDTYQVGAGDPASVMDGGVPILDGPNAGKAAAAGAVDKFGVPREAGSINNRGIYDGYVNLDLYATQKWEWTLGGHVVGYDDVGIHPTGSIGTRYNFSSRLAIRANANTGYRAPTLGEEAFFAETTYPTYRTAQLPVNSSWAKSLGATPLKGEQSRSFSVGVDATLLPNWTLTANLYRISINDRLFNTSQFGGSQVENLLATAGLPGVYYAAYYSNPVNTTTNGGDLATSYTWKTARSGTFQFRFSVNIGDTQISHYNATPALLAGMGLSTFNRTNEEYLLHSSPRNIENLTVLWNKGPYSIRVEEQRFGSYTWVASPSLQQPQWTYAGPSYITNLELGYDILPKWHVAAGAYNVGNHYPAQANAASRAALQNAFLYAGNSPYGFNGGMYYVKTSLRF
ncbi:outer membrane siderophore receptor [Gluconacetobacter johannae DSM 13595]|uniref:TonB-dependent receptor n=1 Tax=Gluconacetobacter johannae TaxID=112140 RepID=A0A7W4J548_9PROT|nr:TonB-dependent receptor [Gluconacetobacter johannae]MBB2174847.1 TonB-dependent receptor [Gluconacetobacter johannae]GBQ87497.1 outer membrane siderophore receptor [Gluconacetobacter johannae DSM 13595]